MILQEAVRAVRARTDFVPEVAIILGTGLGGLAAQVETVASIPYHEIPGFPPATVESHAGRLLLGTLAERRVVAMEGRFHRYEGYSLQQIAFPVRVLRGLGAATLMVSNAAGGLHPLWHLGDLVLIADHVNLLGDSPLVGPNDDRFGPRFPDMSEVYSTRLRRIADAAGGRHVPLAHGTYAAVAGPSYETPAEIRYLRTIGVDAVGMSTVPEAIAARHMGMEVLGLSCISNMAAGVLPRPLDHAEVVETTRRSLTSFSLLLEGIVGQL